MKIVIFGLSITSSWGNGHATTYRALARALQARGHHITFFERDQEWYASNRDMPQPPFCRLHIYENWNEIVSLVRSELADSDVAIVGSYFPDGLRAIEEMFDSRTEVKAFYDIDTPITMAGLRNGGSAYLKPEHVEGFDLYFSFTGGPLLNELESTFGARNAVPLYCSFDPDSNRYSAMQNDYACDLSYMGTYAADRQPKIEDLFCAAARQLPGKRFILAGPQYPKQLTWPENVRRIVHVEPRLHPPFYHSSRLTLNVTRKEMVAAGYSPSVRLFEAAGCGATIVSDWWAGLDTFFTPGEEILLANSSGDIIRYLTEMDAHEIKRIGRQAQQRVIAEHSAGCRAVEFEEHVANTSRTGSPSLARPVA